MKNRIKNGARRSQEQPAPLETYIFAEQQAQAKSGVITSPSGSDATLRTLGDPAPATSTIAGVIRDALALASLLKGVIISFATGKAVIVPTGYADPVPVGTAYFGHFTKDDPTKASSAWTWTDGVDANEAVTAQMESLVAARKPSMSVESLTNAVEDAAALPEGGLVTEGFYTVLHYDQADGEVEVVGTTGGAYDPAASYAEEAAFTRTVAASGGTQFGE